MSLGLGVIGIDHRHIYTMVAQMEAVGGRLLGWSTDGTPETLQGWEKRYPDAPRLDDHRRLLEDPNVDLILLSGIPRDRAAAAIEAMEAGKDVLTDKPGCTTFGQLEALRACVARTGRKWAIDFSERFEVEAVTRASELVQSGAIGRVVQTLGIGPHRLNRATRPAWFFERAAYGGILVDIASHQIDQYLHFTGAQGARVRMASVGNFANPGDPGLQDFGQIALTAPEGEGYIRVDWYTPDALPTWGDGRLVLLGTEGTIELRKYVDIGGAPGTDHLVLVNGGTCEKVSAVGAGYPFFAALADDLQTRAETAASQAHFFEVMELALTAQALAEAER